MVLEPDHPRWLRELSLSQNGLGRAQEALGHVLEALSTYADVVEIKERIVGLDPANAERVHELAISQQQLGKVQETAGRLDQAQASFEKALETLKGIETETARHANWMRNRAVIGNLLGDLHVKRGKAKEAVPILRAALADHGRALALDPALAREHAGWERRVREAELLAGERETRTPADHVDLAYALYKAGRWAEAAAAFEKGLEDETQRDDLDRGNLYNAACMAALASAEGEATWRHKALAWLQEDLRRRYEILRILDERLAGAITEGQRVRFERVRGAIRRHIDWARTGDPDLESLRGRPEFDALFDALPQGR